MAVDEGENLLEFTSDVSMSRDLLEDSILAESISEAKLNQLNNVTCADPTKEFKYWAIMVNGKLQEFNIYSDELKTEYIGSGKTIVLYAVFGDKEVSV